MAQIVVRPEMCGKVIDESHFKFHIEAKAKMIRAINQLRNGVDLLTSLAKQKFSTNKDWLKNSCGDPNVAVLLEILEEYKKNEHRPTRAKVLVPLIEYAIALYASDLFYRERGEWFMFQLVSKSNRMVFASCFVDPNNWYPKTRHLTPSNAGGTPTEYNCGTNYYKLENDPNVKPIEQDYLDWYGLDVTKDIEDIDPELVKRIVKENQDWMKRQDIEFMR